MNLDLIEVEIFHIDSIYIIMLLRVKLEISPIVEPPRDVKNDNAARKPSWKPNWQATDEAAKQSLHTPLNNVHECSLSPSPCARL